MSILAIDYGTKKIGLAISQGVLAQPWQVLANNRKVFSILEKTCQELNIEKIIIGLPEGRLKNKILDFGEECRKSLRVKVKFENEVLTTEKATKFLIEAGSPVKKRKEVIDAAAAAVILQQYLDSKK